MSASIAYSGDAVVNGATEIDVTSFVPVAADYSRLEWDAAQDWNKSLPQDSLTYFPTSENSRGEWSFFARIDLTSTSVTLRNVLGVRIQRKVRNTSYYKGGDIPGKAGIGLEVFNIFAANWFTSSITLTSTDQINFVKETTASVNLLVNPETGQLLYTAVNEWNAFAEAHGLLFKVVEASAPTLAPAQLAIARVYPFT